MIKFEKTEVEGWRHAIRGMRNPMNSWDKSDILFIKQEHTIFDDDNSFELAEMCRGVAPVIGPNDMKLMKNLRNAGTDHRKFMRMLTVYVDITAPLYWWKEFDTYKVGTVANSCSTMHKIHAKEFELDDFSCEHLIDILRKDLMNTIRTLNDFRDYYNNWDNLDKDTKSLLISAGIETKKDIWWQMIQLLPSSYNQKRTVMLNYEVLANIYKSRKNHKLDCWSVGFIDWIKSLPYSELITGEFNKEE